MKASSPILEEIGCKIVSRFFLLYFLENISPSTDPEAYLEVQKASVVLLLNLLSINATSEYAKPVITGSVVFGKKIRLWQSLCILSNHLKDTDVSEILPALFPALEVSTPLSIRVHMEIFTSRLLLLAKDIVCPILIEKLRNYDLSAQVVGTYLVCLGHLIDSSASPTDMLSAQEIACIVQACTPWFSCAPGLPRSIAQLIAKSLIPVYISSKSNSFLSSILEFITQNSETAKMLERQSQFFSDYRLLFRCSLRGIIDLQSTDSGDRIPMHIFNVLTDFLKNNLGVVQEAIAVAKPKEYSETNFQFDSSSVLQKKHIPFSDLQLSVDEFYYRSLNSSFSKIKRQDVIVCASLVDKATNLGGIARTCEVFGVRELIIPDIKIKSSEVFQNIAVSSDCWLPISEVHPKELVKFLQSCKKKGYYILGLEQTDSSRNLLSYTPHHVHLPSSCVLVLGKEKEGIPVDILQEVDECVEIPQFGMTRSLNVHVSAALMIWELTKHNIDESGCIK